MLRCAAPHSAAASLSSAQTARRTKKGLLCCYGPWVRAGGMRPALPRCARRSGPPLAWWATEQPDLAGGAARHTVTWEVSACDGE
jgi:hypothetical protein